MLSNSTRESAILVCSTDYGIRIPKRGMTNEDAQSLILQQHLIVLAERGTKYDTGYVPKTMDPLLSLQTLAANIKHVYSVR
jgi:hypothetical protein